MRFKKSRYKHKISVQWEKYVLGGTVGIWEAYDWPIACCRPWWYAHKNEPIISEQTKSSLRVAAKTSQERRYRRVGRGLVSILRPCDRGGRAVNSLPFGYGVLLAFVNQRIFFSATSSSPHVLFYSPPAGSHGWLIVLAPTRVPRAEVTAVGEEHTLRCAENRGVFVS